MDQRKLILLVSQCPSLWDRNNDKFRDQDLKTNLWNQVGHELHCTGATCRDTFKTLREKYVREREKVQQHGNMYRTWDLFDSMQFLEPHIITRKQGSTSLPDEFVIVKHDPSGIEDIMYGESEMPLTFNNLTEAESCKALIKLVHNMKPLWDRQSKDYNSKQNRDQLWKIIAATLKSDANTCALRWKGLREKYIRQKQKYIEGEGKWELLDELSFLDTVIHYRKKNSLIDESSMMSMCESQIGGFNNRSTSDNELSDERTNDSSPIHPSSSTNGQNQYQQIISNTSSLFNPINLKPHTPDSTLEPVPAFLRKRTLSNDSESVDKKLKTVENQEKNRTPEEIFGEFVSAMLATKPFKEKNLAMVEIMNVLTRPSN